ncbi:ATP-binding protein [Pelagibaculum spongiae]|uniref:histidine kinase n=1 Tax=Pelagibaculum spongiae TaxID=2080658 RepID=A0A2V1GQK6_9GAMM|nr:ATP-binding protein [Pelagibaculum spongiae]PVZ66328.1 hypothetical protein DC094_16660 [Pelagibaculum spongiae]
MPNPSIRFKLAIFLGIFSLMLCAGIYIGVRESFQQGFIGYLNTAREQQLEDYGQALTEIYPDPTQWPSFSLADNWRLVSRQLWVRVRSIEGERREQGRERWGHRKKRQVGKLLPVRLMLFDAAGQLIVGRRPLVGQPLIKTSLVDKEGRLLGWLAEPRLLQVASEVDRLFIEQQNHLFRVVALIALAISLLISWPLSTLLVKPVQRISAAMSRLSSRRDYQARVSITSRDELGQLADDFNHMAETLGEYDDSQRRWVADIAHELRTPLAVMKSEMEALQDGVRDLDLSAIDSLHQEASQLARLIDDLHQLSRADQGSLSYELEPLDIDSLVSQVMDRFAASFSEKGLTPKMEILGKPRTVNGDYQRLVQLFSNLASNSIRYSDSPGQVQVILDFEQFKSSKELEISWQDSSPGVGDEHLEKLFERLFRVDRSRSRALGGSGLGLAIAKSIVKAHRGDVVAQHSELGGLAIKIRLPLSEVKREKRESKH